MSDIIILQRAQMGGSGIHASDAELTVVKQDLEEKTGLPVVVLPVSMSFSVFEIPIPGFSRNER